MFDSARECDSSARSIKGADWSESTRGTRDTFTLALESARDAWDEIQPLLDSHWKEIAHFPDIKLEPRQELYFALQDLGKLRVYTMREGRVMVGYAVFVVDTDIHYASSLQAKQDVLFLLPAYRNTGNGAALITFADAALRREGVQVVYHHVKIAHDFGPLLKALGYQPIETWHCKRLDQGERNGN